MNNHVLKNLTVIAVIVLLLIGVGSSSVYNHGIKLDRMTYSSVCIDYAHHEIHDGDSFVAHFENTTASSDEDRTAIYLKTPATKACHMVASFTASYAATASIYEAPTETANMGTSAAIYNRNRIGTPATSGCFDNATVPVVNKVMTLVETDVDTELTNTGTILSTFVLVAGATPKPAGGASRDTQEWILKASTAYIFIITNVGSNANKHAIQLDWYEH